MDKKELMSNMYASIYIINTIMICIGLLSTNSLIITLQLIGIGIFMALTAIWLEIWEIRKNNSKREHEKTTKR